MITDAFTQPLPQDPLQRALAALTLFAAGLIDALQDALLGPDPTHPIPGTPNPLDAFVRIAAAIRWLAALAVTLDGSHAFLPSRTRAAAAAAQNPEPPPAAAEAETPPEPPTPAEPATQPENPAADLTSDSTEELRRIRRAFATRPIGQIVRDICARIGVDPSSALWPAALIAITQTPAEWVAERERAAAPPQRPRRVWQTPPPTPNPPEPPAFKRPEPPPYHPRE
jgi:hypothetical protein